MTRSPIPLCLAGLLGWMASPAAQADEIPLEYSRFSDEYEEDAPFVHESVRPFEAQLSPPPGEWQLPEIKCARALYCLVELGDAKHLMVLDCQAAGDEFYTRLYFDADADGDLCDDPAIDYELELAGIFTPDPIDVELRVGGARQPYSLRVLALSNAVMEGDTEFAELDPDELELNLVANCCFRGSVELGGKRHLFALFDDDVNGRFDDLPRFAANPRGEDCEALLPASGDLLYLGTGEQLGERDMGAMVSHLRVGDQLLTLAVDGPGRKLGLAPYEGALGSLAPSMAADRILLVDADGARAVLLLGIGGEVKVPPGRYRVAEYSSSRRDDQGDLWFIAAAATRRSPVVELDAGATAKLPLGEPFTPTAWIPSAVYRAFEKSPQKSVEVEFSIVDCSGAVVVGMAHLEGEATAIELSDAGDLPKEPSFFILEKSGKVVARGAFKYG